MTLKINFMHARSHRLETYALPSKGSANDPHASAPTDVATGGDPTREPTVRIFQFGQTGPVAAPTLAIQGGGHPLPQRFMRSLMIVVVDPAGSAPLLAARRGRRRRGHFGFVNAMHLFMGSVVLRPGAAGELDADAQAQPPGRKPRQVQRPIAGKRRPMIDADDFRFSTTNKKLLEILA